MTTETTEGSTEQGYVHVFGNGDAHPLACSDFSHGMALGCNADDSKAGVCTEVNDEKVDLSDPVSRKVVKFGEFTRDLLRGKGCFGRYMERLVTAYCHSGMFTDTYGGGQDSQPFYYENEHVQVARRRYELSVNARTYMGTSSTDGEKTSKSSGNPHMSKEASDKHLVDVACSSTSQIYHCLLSDPLPDCSDGVAGMSECTCGIAVNSCRVVENLRVSVYESMDVDCVPGVVADEVLVEPACQTDDDPNMVGVSVVSPGSAMKVNIHSDEVGVEVVGVAVSCVLDVSAESSGASGAELACLSVVESFYESAESVSVQVGHEGDDVSEVVEVSAVVCVEVCVVKNRVAVDVT